jgi:IMP dehydrogenase
MAKILEEVSRTFGEYLLLPNLTTCKHLPANVDLKTPLVKFKRGEQPPVMLDIPFVSASMQSVSGEKMSLALADMGAIAFIFCSQPIETQAAMVKTVKAQNRRVGAAINTHDYAERIPALVAAGADVLCIDSSDGFSEWQKLTIEFVRKNYGDTVKIGAGNVVDASAFHYLVDAGADFIKVGIGGGSICITREQKGIGRGQASAMIEVAAARDELFNKKGIYIPLCSDGGMVCDYHIIMALAMGSDFVMMGRFFAGFEESPSNTITVDGKKCKEYWGEGSFRARNWQRYGTSEGKLAFEEGVDSYIPHKGSVTEGLAKTVYKIKSTMCNCGSLDIPSFYANARLTVLSPASIVEGGAHNVTVKK